MKAHLRQIRISPKKVNLVAGLVRGKAVADALDILKFTPKKGCDLLYKVVSSAAANAQNNDGKKLEGLTIKTILVTKGPSFKRWIPSIRGRARGIVKFTSHISVELEESVATPTPEKAEKAAEPKKTTKKVTASKTTKK